MFEKWTIPSSLRNTLNISQYFNILRTPRTHPEWQLHYQTMEATNCQLSGNNHIVSPDTKAFVDLETLLKSRNRNRGSGRGRGKGGQVTPMQKQKPKQKPKPWRWNWNWDWSRSWNWSWNWNWSRFRFRIQLQLRMWITHRAMKPTNLLPIHVRF